MYIKIYVCIYQYIFQNGWGTKGVRQLADPLSKIRMGPQRTVAGGGTSKSGGGTGKATHAIMSSSLAQVLFFYEHRHAPDAHNTNFHNADVSRFPGARQAGAAARHSHHARVNTDFISVISPTHI